MSVCNSNDTVDVNCVYIETLEAQLLSENTTRTVAAFHDI